MIRCPLFGDWNQHHPIMSMLSGHGGRIKRKKEISKVKITLFYLVGAWEESLIVKF